uniref:Ergosterol biosynthesis 28 homolog n=1 Tax=Sus scrofa TaxID=9823 RepID=A0A8D0QG08_PIG
MSRFLNVLRSWLVMVSIIAMGNTLQSFRDHTFLYEKLYTGKPDLVNGLQARTFGIWTLLSSMIRCLCAIDIHNKTTRLSFRGIHHMSTDQLLAKRLPRGFGLESSQLSFTSSRSAPSSSPWDTSSPSCLYSGLRHPQSASWHPWWWQVLPSWVC